MIHAQLQLATAIAIAVPAMCLISSGHGQPAPLLLPGAGPAREFLEAHNQARAAVGVGPLKWNQKLGNATSRVVRYQRAKMGCQFANLTSSGRYGANQLWGSGMTVRPRMAVDAWVKERDYYNHADNSCAPNHRCGVYKQVVWRKSLELGCAQATCATARDQVSIDSGLFRQSSISLKGLLLSPALTVGTIICPVHNTKPVRLCIQPDSKSSPLILLDLPLNTSAFSNLIKHGVIRMVFECKRDSVGSEKPPLLSQPQWIMYCNGEKMGFARRQDLTWKDVWFLEMTRTVSTGAGFLPDKGSGGYKYLRGQFKKLPESQNSQAYHLIDPSDSFCHELSVFFRGN